MREYTNYFEKCGYSKEEIDRKFNDIFDTMFYSSEDRRIYFEVEDEMSFIMDTGNIDARTEGMSYGMMMCVQNDKKAEFDRIWKWARTNMYLEEGPNRGFFCWSNSPDGSKNAGGAAPDGEEYFAMALFFASHRWGDGEGIFNYSKEACDLLHSCIREGGDGLGRGMWDRENHLIRFICEVDFSDPSYHLPHFYDLFAKWAYPEEREFFEKAAAASREYLHKACHETSGLSAEYAYFDGSPCVIGQDIWGKHDWYYSDAYRTILNIALDNEWCGVDLWQKEVGAKFINTFCNKVGFDNWDRILECDGSVREEKVLHPVAVIATNAAAAALVLDSDDEDLAGSAKKCIDIFWNTPLREGDRRYYDNCLYIFSYMLLSGKYKIW